MHAGKIEADGSYLDIKNNPYLLKIMKTTDDTRAETSGKESKIKLGLGKFFKDNLIKLSARPTKPWNWAAVKENENFANKIYSV